MNRNIDAETGVPAEFWTLIQHHGHDPSAFCAVLAEMDRDSFELMFLVYVQLRADLADLVLSSQPCCSEDAADDVADGLIARGRDAFLAATKDGVIPPSTEWPVIEESMLLHHFDDVYWERFGEEIWNAADALENERLPWESGSD